MKIKIKQRDITDCGAACLASVSAHYNLRLSVSLIRQYASTDKKGTNILGMVEAAEKLGFTAKGVKGGFDSLYKIPTPAIAHVVIKDVHHHFVVIYGITKKHVRIMDPQDGEIHKKPLDEFKEEWTGVLILLVPTEKFETGDKTTSPYIRFWRLIRPHKTIMTEALVGAVITTILGLSTAIYVQKIVDYVIVDGNRNLLNLMSVLMIAILLLRIFISGMKSLYALRTGQKIDVVLILGYYKHLMNLPQKFFDTMRVGEIISRLSDATKIRSFINNVAINLIVNFLVLIFSFALMFLYSWQLSLIMLGIIPLYGGLYYFVNKVNKKYLRKTMENAADLESQLVESLNAMGTIKRFGLEWHANIKTETRFVQLLKTIYTSGVYSIFSGNASTLISSTFTILLLFTGTRLVLDFTITPGELMSCYALLGYFMGPVATLVSANTAVQDALIATDRLFEIMDLDREEDETTAKIMLTPEMVNDITFENVRFRYGTRVEVFNDFSTTFPFGKVTAIVGESGSGKTTLMSLLQKIYKIDAGKICIGKYDINNIENRSLRNIISVVPQKVDLFAGNVIDNIAVGEFEPDMERITDVCRDLGIIKFIEQLPGKFQTYLGENGANLSGGEKQRIAIARALYQQPEVLILDEAMSSLDSASEEYIQKALFSLKDKGKTVIVIAHRLSTVMKADKIIVLSEGKIIEEDRHEELIIKRGAYYMLWKKQFPMLNNI